MDSDFGRRIAVVAVALAPPRMDVLSLSGVDRAPARSNVNAGLLGNEWHRSKTGKLAVRIHVLDAGGKHSLRFPAKAGIATDCSHHTRSRGSKGFAITDLPGRG